ncbi:ATP-binding protein [Sphingomonas sp. Leaf37]|uniref:ATP-binding protein n=1 Tax=Sphingomonas sp. Leaf37 TaxID=2876552 RepID=UPI001E3230F4|nr:ATP-binding protein [Sphingomonas sp. Leaf37]
MTETRLFDLNINKIFEASESTHAIRELIVNAIDKRKLSATGDIAVFKADDGSWTVRDYGRGLHFEHFTTIGQKRSNKISSSDRWIGAIATTGRGHAERDYTQS